MQMLYKLYLTDFLKFQKLTFFCHFYHIKIFKTPQKITKNKTIFNNEHIFLDLEYTKNSFF